MVLLALSLNRSSPSWLLPTKISPRFPRARPLAKVAELRLDPQGLVLQFHWAEITFPQLLCLAEPEGQNNGGLTMDGEWRQGLSMAVAHLSRHALKRAEAADSTCRLGLCLSLRTPLSTSAGPNPLPRLYFSSQHLSPFDKFYVLLGFFVCLFIFVFFRAAPTAYGGSQARGLNRSCSRWPTPEPQQCGIHAPSATHTTAHGNGRILNPLSKARD